MCRFSVACGRDGKGFALAAVDAQFLEDDERVLGFQIDGHYKAYPFAELSRSGSAEISDAFAGRRLRIRFDHAAESARVFDEDGVELAAVTGFWFAWYAFHPDTEIFSAGS